MQVTAVVIVLILVDLISTFVNDTCENTDWVNPAYDERKEKVAAMTHNICVTVLFIFLFEQILHLIAFGDHSTLRNPIDSPFRMPISTH